MSAPKCLTLGDLRAATADMPDDVRVVVDGYEGGYDDITLSAPLVLLGKEYSWGGPHSEHFEWDDTEEVAPTLCLCLSRGGGHYEEDEDAERLTKLRATRPQLADALADLHTIVDGDDIDPAATLAELREPSGYLLGGVEDLRAQVAALTAERDRLRALVREQVSCECSNDDACRFVRERDEARAERDRLARVLACEVGDAEHASDGWQRDVHHRWSRRSPDFYLVAFKWGGTHTWEVWDNSDGTLICHGRAKYALDAMEAADEAARAGEAS